MNMKISSEGSSNMDVGRMSNIARDSLPNETKSVDTVAKKTGIFSTLIRNIRSKFFKISKGKIPSSGRSPSPRLPTKKLISLVTRFVPKRANQKSSLKSFVEDWKDTLKGDITKKDAENTVKLLMIGEMLTQDKSKEETLSQLKEQKIDVNNELFNELIKLSNKFNGAPESKDVCLKAYGEACKKLDISPEKKVDAFDLINDAIGNLKGQYEYDGGYFFKN